MKKILAIILGALMPFGLAGCRNKEKKPDFEITVEFSFAKKGNASKDSRDDWFDSDVFEINTKIYVFVDFSITKHCSSEEIINFQVEIPYAEYYPTKEYWSGTIKPHEELKEQEDKYGNRYTVTELTKMPFVFDDNDIHDYHYVFLIEANQECENANFITRFFPDNRHLSVSVNGNEEDDRAMTSYTFVGKE